MLENKLKPLINGLILVMAFFLAPLASGTGLTTHQNHGKRYYYDGKQIPYYNSPRYHVPRGNSGYHYNQGYSRGYYQPPYNYHGHAYYPYNPQAHENAVPQNHGTQGYHQGYDQGYHDGYRDAPNPQSGGVIYLHKGTRW